MATKTLNLPKMSFWQLKELSECKRPDKKKINNSIITPAVLVRAPSISAD